MKIVKVALCMLVILFALAGCGGDGKPKVNTREIIIPKTEFYKYLYIQGVNDQGVSTEKTGKLIKDPAKVQDFIRVVNRSVVMVPKTEKQASIVKQLDKHGSYIVALGDTEKMDKLTYKIYMLKDGTLFFQDTMKKEMTYMTVKKQPEKLAEMKKMLGVKF